jgi:hypothetical protein
MFGLGPKVQSMQLNFKKSKLMCCVNFIKVAQNSSDLPAFKFLVHFYQCFGSGSGSGWIHTQIAPWIRIRIRYGIWIWIQQDK